MGQSSQISGAYIPRACAEVNLPEQLNRIFFPQAVFLLSADTADQMPPDRGAEVAFAGRSNAGKSSALNAICGRRMLARTSKTPGRTRLINFFSVDDSRRLVDLPGYGYARVPASVKERWQESMAAFLDGRRCLRGIVVIVDVRQLPGTLDWQMLEWCQAVKMPALLLLSKSDKLSRGAAAGALAAARSELALAGMTVPVQLFSATTHEGVEEAATCLYDWLEMTGGRGHKKSPGNKGRESGAYKQSRRNLRDFPRSGRRSG
ncbi:MAG: ribosome biogenesis GTP-binding protein YihA/YsxC [Pseudomonadota bacterium]|nr:ribosome biogenesis GTP-binding protein YihA/YsxC [Pseudomonadota bacterium]